MAANPAPPVVPARRLRIALLGYRSQPYGGGQGVYLRYLSKGLVDAGHKVDVISGPPYPHLDPRVRLIELPSLDLFENGLMSLRPRHLKSMTNIIEWTSKLTGGFAEPYTFGRRAVKYLRQHAGQYDLIHDNQSLSWGMLELQRMGLPLVTTVHHPITSDLRIALNAARNPWERLLIRRWHSFLNMQKKVVKQLHNVVTVSDCSRQDIARDFGIQPAGISLVYNGIDTEVFRPLAGIERRPLRLMATCSADAPLKGTRYLLRAYAKLLETYPQLELLLVSKPLPGGKTEKLVKKLGLQDKIQFVSGISTEQMVQYYAEATVAVVPSVYEGFGLPAGEAMACGVPVVSTDGGALPEVVGDAGVLVPAKSVDALAGAIDDLLRDPARRVALGEAGRERILEKFCWQVCAREMGEYYKEVLRTANADR
ncbi:glycosyltransferase family 1 protein [Seongchinamella unica]|uniref:Glycosyltransferase family 1 protein n=1 Tax=Seongchinamella unica TaxID=2547392 RepID=A0A4R5LX43_9GAMM|nr:glycosyltransferase family 4 protein [Seongchinamella unica]TDG15848.1 glycosyltransferase family 1 protein [Seongchinamella unica]